MHVDFHRQTRIENHFDGGIEIAEIFVAAAVAACSVHHRLRIHAEPHVVEPGRLDQRDVGGRGPVLKCSFVYPLGS